MPGLEAQIQEIAGLLTKARTAFALTGAGISTESGIPDFRSPGKGLWVSTQLMDVLTSEVLQNEPERFYKAAMPLLAEFAAAEPNPAHRALAELERLGHIYGIITQNIDGLHQRAGSQRVWEVHGHLRTGSCVCCGRKQPFARLQKSYEEGEIPPRCPACGHMLRPDVVMFNEPLARDFFDVHDLLYGGCDLMLVVGSSLTVYPAAGLVTLARDLVIINLQPTPYDEQARVVIREKAGEVLPKIVAAVRDMSP
ncbi:MAG: NAD-dependent deacylase [Peptococcaceae bacterium]|nr:NAD-dependent deacylase [Peptococcaceae bacterium]